MPNPTPTIFVPYHAVDDLHRIGTRALQPSAVDVTPGTLYCVTDEGNKVERSSGLTWQGYSPSGAAAHHVSHEVGGSDQITGAMNVSSIIATDAYFNSLGTTPLNASYLASGTIQDARLPSSVPLKHLGNTFTTVQQIITAFNYATFYFKDSLGPLWFVGSSGGDFYIADNEDPTSNGLQITKVGKIVKLLTGKLGFPALQNASSDPGVLDDYRETSSWTPAFTGSSGSGTTHIHSATALKIGRLVYAQCFVELSDKGTLTGAVNISGLPYAGQNIANAYGSTASLQWNNLVTPWSYIWGLILPLGTGILLRGCPAGGGTTSSQSLMYTDLANASSFLISAMYLSQN